ncbi:MAG: ATP-binding protein [Gemmatimonas sp.]|uniref:sensor histidine kinase n=1 Tax=Gemmatimonas sp. TaxID=1962908 RepID=UPI0031C40D84|nr:ATP-binding protein [Gemmatimonas sp.]
MLANAVRFAQPHGDEPAAVLVSAGTATQPPEGVALRGKGPWVFIRVEDTGPGVSGEQWDSIFEPFVQLSPKDRPPEGAGLGLHISRRYARQMGGDISFDVINRLTGEGAVFTVWLLMAPLDSLQAGGT